MAQKAVAEVAFVFGHQLDKDQVEAMAGVIIAGGWTIAELEYAAAFIPTDEELCQTITYNRTINPTVFAKAKKRKEVMRGRTFTRSEAMQLCEYKDFYFTFEQFRVNESTVYVMR